MTAKQITNNESRNSILDRLFQGAAMAGVVFLATDDIVPHVKATEPMNWVLAGAAVGLMLYLAISPIFRNK